MSAEPSALSKIAAFSVAAAGLTAIFAGGQVWMSVTFLDALPKLGGPLQVVAGVAAVWTAIQLAHPRGWARFLALALLLGMLCGGFGWFGWLSVNGIITALNVFAPLFALVALVLVAASWRDIGKKSAIRAEAEAETARLVAEALRNPIDDGLPPMGPPRRGWVLPVIYTVVAMPASVLGMAIFTPEAYAAMDAQVRGVLAGRNPFASTVVENATDYPYKGDPLEWYLDYESKWVPTLPKEQVLSWADDIADHVAVRLAGATGDADPQTAEAALWKEGRAKEIPLWIAEALRQREVFYSPESLFSRSFDPELHVAASQTHLDCDQLVYVFLHVARRLDFAMKAVPSPFHMYVRFDPPTLGEPIFVETTQFRSIDVRGNTVDFMGRSIGDTFFPSEDYYPSGRSGTWAAPELVAAAGFYQPATERDLHDSIAANVLVGVKELIGQEAWQAEVDRLLPGSRNPTLIPNAYSHHAKASAALLAEGRLEEARAAALRARAIRAEFGVLVVYGDPREESVLATLDALELEAAAP